MPNQLAEHLKCSKTKLTRYTKQAGVKRRVRYLAGDNKPVYYPFTEAEVERILRVAWADKGSRAAIKMGVI